MAARTKGRWLELDAVEARARLAALRLPRTFHNLALHALRRDEGVLWCDGAWSRPRKPPIASLAHIALVVIDGPLVSRGGLSLRYDDLVGGGLVARDDAAFLFLGEVHTQDVFTVPVVLALFPRGITVDRLASFEGADGHVLVANHLHAPLVVSGVSGSGVTVTKDASVRIGAYAGHVLGLPKRDPRRHDGLAELLPFLADEVEDTDAWELLEELKGKRFPKSFVLPSLPRETPAKKPSGASGPPKRATKKAPPQSPKRAVASPRSASPGGRKRSSAR